MRKPRHRPAQRRNDLDLRGRVGHMIRAAHHIRDAIIDVVAHRGQRIQKLPVAPDQHRVRHACRIDRAMPQNAVFPLDPLVIQPETPMPVATLGAQPVLVRITQRQRTAVIHRRLAHVQLFLALQVKLGRCLETFIEPPHVAQVLRRLFIARQPVRLFLDPVPGQAQPLQILLDRINIFLLAAVRVGIIDPQDECAAGLAGNQVIHQRGAQVAHMDISGGRRGETGGDHVGLLLPPPFPQSTRLVHSPRAPPLVSPAPPPACSRRSRRFFITPA